MSALVGWTDHAQGGSISTSATQLMDASNMLLPGGPTRARFDADDPLVYVLDLGAACRLDAICLLGINARQEWDIDVVLGLSAPGDMGVPSMIGNAYSSARSLPWGASPIIALGASYAARYISISADWDIGSDGYYDIRRMLAYECVRSRGMSIEAQMLPQHTGQALVSKGRAAEIDAGYGYREWAGVLTNIGRNELWGNELAPGTTPALTDLAANFGNLKEVLLIPRTDSAHMLQQTAIVGHVKSFEIPSRTRGDRGQHARFQLDELLYRS